jgi:hypothetical protein
MPKRTSNNFTLSDYYKFLCQELVESLTANTRIRQITSNPAIIGAYAEASIRAFVEKTVAPSRVSTGSIVSPELLRKPEDLPQIDLIIWNPAPLPPIFHSGEFAIVPYQSCLGIIEIKRSNYSKVGAKLKAVLERAPSFVKGVPPKIENAPIIVSNTKDGPTSATGRLRLRQRDNGRKGLGVICVKEHKHHDDDLEQLIRDGDVSVLLERNDAGKVEPNLSGVLGLVNFLAEVRRRSVDSDGVRKLNIDFINNT